YSDPLLTELIGYFWSGKHHRVVKGIQLITLYYNDKSGKSVPINYRIYNKEEGKTKNQIDPNTVEYPQKWTKEFQAFGTQSVNSEQQEMIESSAKILHQIKERPTFLFSTESNEKLGVMGLALDAFALMNYPLMMQGQNVPRVLRYCWGIY